jgi:CRISPR/Cas system-associated endonuclease Cas1
MFPLRDIFKIPLEEISIVMVIVVIGTNRVSSLKLSELLKSDYVVAFCHFEMRFWNVIFPQ